MADNICPHGHTTGTAKNDHIWNKFAVFKINISIMVAQVAAFLVSLVPFLVLWSGGAWGLVDLFTLVVAVLVGFCWLMVMTGCWWIIADYSSSLHLVGTIRLRRI